MTIKDSLIQLATTIAKSAPLLATALGSPLAGVALNILGTTFGVDPSLPDGIYAKILADPDAAMKLKGLEQAHELELKQITLSTYQAQLADLQNARAAKTATETFTGHKDWVISFLVVAAVVIFACCILGAYFSNGAANQMYLFLIGQQSGVYLSVYTFYFSGIDPKRMFDDISKQQTDKQVVELKK